MIGISTLDFIGLLNDTIPFSFPEDDLPGLHCVRVEWDGQMMHALSTDLTRVAWSSWHPDDDTPGADPDQLSVVNPWGGADSPWAVVLRRPDAEKLVQVFKLPTKRGLTPLQVSARNGRLFVKRDRVGGSLALSADVEGSLEEFPDLRKELAAHDRLSPVTGVAYNATQLADFSLVRPRGPMQLAFAGDMTHVVIGDRFRGGINPATVGLDHARRTVGRAEV